MNLSQRRANNIAKLLSTKFKLDNNRLSALGFGSIYPLADNNTIQGRAKNRRVSIFFYE
jgi:chemotaxis protein MotB